MINVDVTRVKSIVSDAEFDLMLPKLLKAHEALLNGTDEGSDFLGWIALPQNFDKDEFDRIKSCAEKIRKNSEVFIVVGIGGSYLGARAAIEFVKGVRYNQTAVDFPEVYFVGNNLSTDYYKEIIEIIGERDFSINVISKSGSTIEPAIAFRIFKQLLVEKYGKKEAQRRIYVTTDKERGELRKIAEDEGYETFVIPDNIGGRYSVLTPVALLPMAVAGVDIGVVLLGAKDAMREITAKKDFSNPAWLYAASRNILYSKGRKVEILASFETKFRFLCEWWKQLFGESEGKERKGIFPASVELTSDLHSMGQYIQEGERIIQETFLSINKPANEIYIPDNWTNFDGLNYLAGKSLHFVNHNAYRGTAIAHEDGGVPNICIELLNTDEKCFGYLVYFFEFSCALSGYILGVNPFNQPGVEAYKTNMLALLGKPGYEEHLKEISEK